LKKHVDSTVDVLSHAIFPEMSVVKEGDKGKILKEFGIDETMLPRMRLSDPAAVALKAKAGDLLKIKRNDGTGEYVSYRIVVDS
jgi:DNA-directed RNA polymerase subunit H